MSNLPEKRIIDKCVDKILKAYIDYNCHVVKLNPFNDKSKEFSIVYEGYVPWINSTEVTIQDKGIDRIFLFQIRTGYNGCYADDWFLTRTDHYLYEGELTEYPEKGRILYECDRRACSGTCYKDCYYTSDITHAKNFECADGLWFERYNCPETEM